MSSRTLLALLLGLVLAGGVLFLCRDLIARRFGSVPAGQVAPIAAEDDVRSGGRDVDASKEFVDPAALGAHTMDEETAKALFPALRRGRRKIYDPEAWAVLSPNHGGELPWPEAATGSVNLRTNNLGFREDEDTLVDKRGQRIFVVGDSHTEGVVDNARSFANVLERLLGERGGDPVEVINAGVGGTGPHNFQLMVEKFAHLQPDMVIATLYSGNDTINALTISDFYSKRPSPPRDAAYKQPLIAATKTWIPVPQGFNQAYYFAFAPEEATIALQATVDVFEDMNAFCTGKGIRLVVLILPSKPDVESDDDETVDDILRALDMTRADFALNLQLARQAGDVLRARGITVIDPTDAMRAADGPSYWLQDHHLNTAGHALVGELLAAELFPSEEEHAESRR